MNLKRGKSKKLMPQERNDIKMKFTKGMLIGGMITAGIMMMYADNNMNAKKMMKKGKQLAKKMGIM